MVVVSNSVSFIYFVVDHTVYFHYVHSLKLSKLIFRFVLGMICKMALLHSTDETNIFYVGT